MVRVMSKRERRLWGWALAVLIAIYSTAAWGGSLVRVLGEQDLLGAAFAVGFLLVITAVLGFALHRPPRQTEVWVGVGVVAVYGMVLVRLGTDPIERTHLFEYGLLAVLIYEALLERDRTARSVPVPAALAVVITALLGWIDEGIQALVPQRVYDLRDVGVNALAGLLATVAFMTLTWARQRNG